MKQALVRMVVVMMLGANLFGQAQQSVASNASTVVPTLVKFSGTLTDVNGKPLTGTAGVTFALYANQQGGAPLWIETQSVALDRVGHYSVQLGSTTSRGLPTDLFTSGEARWLGVQPEGQAELPRVLLLSVPYALKAADAETLGGFPPSAFVLAGPPASGNAATTSPGTAAASSSASAPPPVSSNVTTTGGTLNTIPMFTTATNIQSSLLTQTGTTAINVGGTLNLPATGTATAVAGFKSRPHNFVASVFNSGTSTAVAQTFQLQAEPLNNDTASASGTLNLLYGSGTAIPAETGLKISNKGLITFATGQTFPGTGSGTVKSVASGAGLTGGPITGSGTLSIATGGVSNTMLAHPSLTVAAGTDLTGGGAVALGGTTTLNLDTTKVPQLNVANTFTGNQTIKGNLSDTGNISATGSITGQTGSYTANNSTQVLNITQTGSGNGISSVANGGIGLAGTGNIGVSGTGGPGFSSGVNAVSPAGFGVFASTTSGIAVFATSNAANGVGSIEGFAGSSATGATTPGVTGFSVAQAGVGTRGLWLKASTVGATVSQIGVWGDSSNGTGVTGTSDSGVGVAAQSASFHAISAVSNGGAGTAGINALNTNGGYGVFAQATGSAGQGVWGESLGTGFSNGAGSDGVHGISHTTAGSGVAGINDAKDATGVFGSDTQGYGFVTDSHVSQGRSAGGWVKAMAYIDFGGTVRRCFNSQLAGSEASTVPCGITVTVPVFRQAIVDFGFEIDDRFVQITFNDNQGSNQFYELSSDGASVTNTQVFVEDNSTFPSNFYVVVY
jgi:hypothetical protein